MQLNPYLGFNGQCREAFTFYGQCLGGKVVAMMTYAETPMADKMPAEMQDKIAHARLMVGDKILMGSDSPPSQFEAAKGFHVTPAEADRIFAALAKNATIQMPIEETFWAKRFGMLIDQYGTPWMINCEKVGS
ncbi:VOC family protein [Glaciimonas sp. PCH181]|uniref:VOC family protein n=1 Tax=Glaciimonas sp. PCH181 TaxID=2133943 RepID=UPI000D3CFDC2|nr:VOC family protein [Glaciimonas sp. PCH181]PUA17800.1 VOC family protein [Glaciimonas sp. PCH181]